MAKIKATSVFGTSFEGTVYAFSPGQEIEVPDKLANKLANGGLVEIVSTTRKSSAADEKAEK